MTKKKNIFAENEMCVVPESVADLNAYLGKFSGTECVIAFTVCGMTWNLCRKMLEESGLLEESK